MVCRITFGISTLSTSENLDSIRGPNRLSRYRSYSSRSASWGLGFGMAYGAVLQTGRTTLVYTGVGIALAMTSGVLMGRFLSVPFNSAFLISAGTAICGGSAIAAVCPIIDAREDETAISFSTVFVLNSLALLVFPS